MGRPKINTPETMRVYKSVYFQKNKQRLLALQKEWQNKNQEKYKAGKKAWAVKNRAVVEERRKLRVAKDPERFAMYQKRYVSNNREKVRLSKQRWNIANRDYQKKYLAGHPEKFREASLRRRANKKANSTPQQLRDAKIKILSMMEKELTVCAYCSYEFITDDMHVDHILPLARGGAHSPENLTMACLECNLSKGDRILYAEWNPPCFNNAS